MDQGPAELVGRLEGSAKGRTGAAKRHGNLVFEMEVAAPDHRHVGRDAAEGVGLVHETGGQYALHVSPRRLRRRATGVISARFSRGQGCYGDQVFEDSPSGLGAARAAERPESG